MSADDDATYMWVVLGVIAFIAFGIQTCQADEPVDTDRGACPYECSGYP